MKVQCGQCPAKYAVSDERIHDKKVRIHCKRCGASIVVDGKVDPPLVTSTPARPSVRPGDSAPPFDAAAPAERLPPSERMPRPVAHTIMGGLEAPAEVVQRLRAAAEAQATAEGGALPSARRGASDLSASAEDNRWRVALTKQDLRWMTTAEIVDAYHAGAVKLETFVFRTGMPNWVTLLEVPEIAEALAEAGEDVGDVDALPPGAAASTKPPPRKSAPEIETSELSFEGEEEEEDPGETVPFALVAERANATPPASPDALAEIVTSAAPSAAPAPPKASPPLPSLSEPAPAAMPEGSVPPAFAAAQQASSGGSRWIWAVVVVVVIGAAALVLPRLGVRLF